jgi:hypothetical protein
VRGGADLHIDEQRKWRLIAACATHALSGLHPDERMRGEHAAYAREVFAAERISLSAYAASKAVRTALSSMVISESVRSENSPSRLALLNV